MYREVKLIEKDGRFGITDCGELVVPFWSTKEEAIFEWRHFQELNITLKVLTPLRTQEEINEIINKL